MSMKIYFLGYGVCVSMDEKYILWFGGIFNRRMYIWRLHPWKSIKTIASQELGLILRRIVYGNSPGYSFNMPNWCLLVSQAQITGQYAITHTYHHCYSPLEVKQQKNYTSATIPNLIDTNKTIILLYHKYTFRLSESIGKPTTQRYGLPV